MSDKSIDVVIPVQNMARMLPDVLTPLISQRAPGDRIVIVDDASTDDTGKVATGLGAEVITLSESKGPYYARQIAASRSKADVLLFMDGRCRPLPGLLEAHRALQREPNTVLSCTGVWTRSGPSLAARVAELKQPISLHGAVGVPGRPDYFPTANLGIDRQAFAAVGGFRAMRSGGDADICWRIQEQSLGVMGVDRRILMEWEPRSSMRSLASQFKRYGGSTVYLRWVYGDYSPAPFGLNESMIARIKSELNRRRGVRRATPVEWIARLGIDTAFQLGYIQAKFRTSQFEPPQAYGLLDAGNTSKSV
jgi:glycosyltransferase involved in cell wall biosynthesis